MAENTWVSNVKAENNWVSYVEGWKYLSKLCWRSGRREVGAVDRPAAGETRTAQPAHLHRHSQIHLVSSFRTKRKTPKKTRFRANDCGEGVPMLLVALQRRVPKSSSDLGVKRAVLSRPAHLTSLPWTNWEGLRWRQDWKLRIRLSMER